MSELSEKNTSMPNTQNAACQKKNLDTADNYATSTLIGCCIGGGLAFLGIPVPTAVKIGKLAFAAIFGPTEIKTFIKGNEK